MTRTSFVSRPARRLGAAVLLFTLTTGCAKPPVEEPAPVAVPAPAPELRPLEDVAAARKQAREQNRPLVVLSVLGDYKKHC